MTIFPTESEPMAMPDADAEPTKQPASEKLPHVVWNVVKWLVVAIAVAYLWRTGALSRDRLRLAPGWAFWLPAAALLQLLTMTAVGARFHCILRCLDAPSSLTGQVKISLSGLLAQQIGSEVAYDVMRMVASKRMGCRMPAIVAAVAVDRFLGVLALGVLTVAGLSLIGDAGDWRFAAALALGALVCVPLGFAVWYRLVASGRFPWLARIPGWGFVVSVCDGVSAFRRHIAALGALLAVSLAGHVSWFAAIYCCGAALAGVDLTPGEALAGGSVASFTAALPLPMAGLGVGEAAFGEVVALMRRNAGAAGLASVFLVNRVASLTVGTAAWLWLALPERRRAEAVGADAPVEEEST